MKKPRKVKSIKLNITLDKDFFNLLQEKARADYMRISTKAKQLLYKALLEKNYIKEIKMDNNESTE